MDGRAKAEARNQDSSFFSIPLSTPCLLSSFSPSLPPQSFVQRSPFSKVPFLYILFQLKKPHTNSPRHAPRRTRIRSYRYEQLTLLGLSSPSSAQVQMISPIFKVFFLLSFPAHIVHLFFFQLSSSTPSGILLSLLFRPRPSNIFNK